MKVLEISVQISLISENKNDIWQNTWCLIYLYAIFIIHVGFEKKTYLNWFTLQDSLYLFFKTFFRSFNAYRITTCCLFDTRYAIVLSLSLTLRKIQSMLRHVALVCDWSHGLNTEENFYFYVFAQFSSSGIVRKSQIPLRNISRNRIQYKSFENNLLV